MPRRMPHLRAVATIAGIVALGAAVAPPAFAGPDDAKTVLTEGHVDAPKAFWEGNNFVLKGEQGGNLPKIDDAVIWMGKGTGTKEQYIYEVGEGQNDSILGDKGALLYHGQAAKERGFPIWAGFGADIGIPTDKLRDGTFSMDIVGFNGPGRMDIWRQPFDGTGPNIMWSSHRPGLRSAWVAAGSHTHNETTFTKPGRYEVTYQATARDKKGNRIVSEPQTMVWQVGGSKPNPKGLHDVADAYNASNVGQGLANPTFSIAPHQPVENDVPGADKLTDLVFDSGDAANDGHAVFFIDGYYLAEIPLENGKAVWPEMIGSYSSNFQVAYIPASHGARWVSEPLKYDRTMDSAETKELGKFPVPATQDEPEPFDNNDYEVSDPQVTISAQEVDIPAEGEMESFSAAEGDEGETGEEEGEYTEKGLSLTVTPADPRVTARVIGYGLDADGDHCSDIAFTSNPDMRTRVFSADSNCTTLKLSVIPNSQSSVGGVNLDLKVGEDQTVNLTQEGVDKPVLQVGKDEHAGGGEGTDDGKEEPQPGNDENSEGGDSEDVVPGGEKKPAPEEDEEKTPPAIDGRFHIDRGHVDFGPVLEDGELGFRIGDDSGLEKRERVYREPDKTALVVGNDRRREVNGRMKKLDFLPQGQKVYLMSQTQVGNELWPGFSTEHAGDKAYDIQVRPKSHPEGASWWAWTSNNTQASVAEWIGGSDKGTMTLSSDTSMHVHNNWAFTQPGIYEIEMRAVEHGTESGGTDWETIHFIVGNTCKPGDDPELKPGKDQEKPKPKKPGKNKPGNKQGGSVPGNGGGSNPGAAPNPGAGLNPDAGLTPGGDAPVGEQVEISQGHIDLGPVGTSSKADFMLADESNQHGTGKINRKPGDVTMVVGNEFAHRLTDSDVEGALDFLGAAGQVIHLVGQTQQGNQLWPGFSTQHAGGDPWDIEISPESGPGQWYAFLTDGFGSATHVADSSGTAVFSKPNPHHTHVNWAFTEPGTYTMQMRATNQNNPSVTTEWETVTFRVAGGDVAAAADENAAHAPGNLNGAAPAAPAAGAGAKKAAGAAGKAGGAKPAGAAASGARSGGASGAAGAAGKPGGAKSAGAKAAGAKAAGAKGAPGAPDAKGAKDAKKAGKAAKAKPKAAAASNAASQRTWRDTAANVVSALLSAVGAGLGGVALYRRFF